MRFAPPVRSITLPPQMVRNLFEQIFPNTTISAFLREDWPHRPLLHHGSLCRLPQLQALGDPMNIIALLTGGPERRQPKPNVMIATPRTGYRTQFRTAAPRWAPGIIKSFLVKKALRRGESINAESFERASPTLRWMSDELARCLGLPLSIDRQVETWITPAKKEAIDKHFDNDDRIIIQLAGKKRWWIEVNSDLEYPVKAQHARESMQPANRPFARDIAIPLEMDDPEEFVMEAGSAVFLPRGYWHRTSAVENSAAVMFRFAAPTVADLIANYMKVRTEKRALRVPLMGAWQAHANAATVEQALGVWLAEAGVASISPHDLIVSFEPPPARSVGLLEETAFFKERAYAPASALTFDRDAAPACIRLGPKSVAQRDDIDGTIFAWLARRQPCSAQEIAECSALDLEPTAYRLAQLRLSGYIQDAPVVGLTDPRCMADGVLELLQRKSAGRETLGMCLSADRLSVDTSSAEAFALLDAFYEAGGTFIDTAAAYPWAAGMQGDSERLVGAWIAAHGLADRIVVGTKGGAPVFGNSELRRGRLGRDHLARELEGSLKRLGVDRVDLYWLHRDEMDRPVCDILETLDGFVRDGLIDRYGASNWRIGRLREAAQLAGELQGFVARQAGLSLAHLSTVVGFSATEFARRWHAQTQLPWVAYSVSAGGYFSAQASAAALRGFVGCPGHERDGAANRRRQRAAAQVAAELGVSAQQVAIAYVRSLGFPAYPILRTRTATHLREAVDALALQLSSAQRARLETPPHDAARRESHVECCKAKSSTPLGHEQSRTNSIDMAQDGSS